MWFNCFAVLVTEHFTVQKIFEVIQKLKEAKSTDEIPAILYEVSELVEFDYFLLGIAFPNTITSSDILLFDNYPKAWRQAYDSEGYIQIDPIVKYSQSNYLPIKWSELGQSMKLKKPEKDLMRQASSHGLQSGFSLPIHGSLGEFGMISYGSSKKKFENDQRFMEAIPVVQMILPAVQDTVKRLRDIQPESSDVKLTPREIECLTWATEGKSSWEISQILGCSERTAIFHLTNAATKLGANNRYQAISKALLSGVLSPALF